MNRQTVLKYMRGLVDGFFGLAGRDAVAAMGSLRSGACRGQRPQPPLVTQMVVVAMMACVSEARAPGSASRPVRVPVPAHVPPAGLHVRTLVQALVTAPRSSSFGGDSSPVT